MLVSSRAMSMTIILQSCVVSMLVLIGISIGHEVTLECKTILNICF